MSDARQSAWIDARSLTILFTLIGSLSACDPIYGVRRSAKIDVDPTPGCVERVLRNTSEIVSVEHKRDTGGRPLTWSGVKSPTIVETFYYKGPDHVRGVLQYTKDDAGRLEFWQANIAMGRAPPEEEISSTRPVMRKVELALESQCGLVGLVKNVTEQCWGEECPPLDK